MPSPKIGRKQQQTIIDLSPAEEAARVAAGVPLDAALTESEVQNREAQKQALLATLPKESTPETPATTAVETREPVANMIAKFTAKTHAVTAARVEERQREARALEAGMIAEAHSLVTRQGQLKKKYQPRVQEAAGTDWPALLAAVPEGLTSRRSP